MHQQELSQHSLTHQDIQTVAMMTLVSSCTAEAASGGPMNNMHAVCCRQIHHCSICWRCCAMKAATAVLPAPAGRGGGSTAAARALGAQHEALELMLLWCHKLGTSNALSLGPRFVPQQASNHLTAYFALCIVILQSCYNTMTQDKTIFSCRSHIVCVPNSNAL